MPISFLEFLVKKKYDENSCQLLPNIPFSIFIKRLFLNTVRKP